MSEALDVEMRRVRLGDLVLLPTEKNARFMTDKQFQQLVNNIRVDGVLTSVPLARIRDDKSLLVLSGNHRVSAAIEALGADAEVDVMVTTSPLSRAREVALQLSHNAIAGQDDRKILTELYLEIDDFDWREFSALDPAKLDLEEVEIPNVSEPTLEYQTLSIVFLPEDLAAANAVVEEATSMIASAQERWAARYHEHDRMLNALDQSASVRNTKDRAAALMAILDVFEAHATDLTVGLPDKPEPDAEWVPISTILGTDRLPPDVAAELARVTGRFVTDGDIQPSERWRIVTELVTLVDAYDDAADRLRSTDDGEPMARAFTADDMVGVDKTEGQKP